jgi:CrcB protein
LDDVVPRPAAARSARPAHLQPALVALVALGGVVGTAARYGLASAWPTADGGPVATLTANLLGAFLLGALLEALAGRAETARGRLLRLAVGTGVLGGFTTFSSLAIEIERFAVRGEAATGVAYGLVSVALGVTCALAGVAVAARAAGRRTTEVTVPAEEEGTGAGEDAGTQGEAR